MNGSGIPAIGMMPIVMPTFSNTWNTSMASPPTQIRVPPRRRPPAPPPPHEQEQAEQHGRADQPEVLAHRGEDEVGVLLRHVRQVGLGPPEQTLARHPARADGD